MPKEKQALGPYDQAQALIRSIAQPGEAFENPYDAFQTIIAQARAIAPVTTPREPKAPKPFESDDGLTQRYLALTISLPAELATEDAEIIKLFIEDNATNLSFDEEYSISVIEGVTSAKKEATDTPWRIGVVLRTSLTNGEALNQYQAEVSENASRKIGTAFLDSATAIEWAASQRMQQILEIVLKKSGCDNWEILKADLNSVWQQIELERPDNTRPIGHSFDFTGM